MSWQTVELSLYSSNSYTIGMHCKAILNWFQQHNTDCEFAIQYFAIVFLVLYCIILYVWCRDNVRAKYLCIMKRVCMKCQ